MRLRRIGKIDVHARVSGNDTISTGFVFYSYAKNSNALEFHFKDQQGRPVDLLGTKVRLLLIVKDNGEDKEFKTLDEEIVTESSLNGIVRYIIPDRLMGYQGIVDGWIYLDFPDGSKTDEVHFRFTMERSKIDQEAPLIRDFYVPLFEEIVDSIKAELSIDAGKAKNDISQMVIDTQKITQEEQEKIQAELPKLQETLISLNTSVDEALEKVDVLKTGVKLSTLYKMSDGRLSKFFPNPNLLPGTSINWSSSTFTGWVNSSKDYALSELGLNIGDTITISAELDATNSSVNICTGFSILVASGAIVHLGNTINAGNIGTSSITHKLESNDPIIGIRVFPIRKFDSTTQVTARYRKHKLEKSSNKTIYVPKETEANSPLDYFPIKKGLGIIDSNSEADFIWQYTDEYIDYLIGFKASKEELNALANRVAALEPK